MFQSGPMALIGSLGVVSKVVLFLLLLLSVVSWAVILLKWKVFKSADAEDRRFMAVLVKAKDVDEVVRHAHRSTGSPCAKIIHGVVDRLGTGRESQDGGGGLPVDRHVMERTAQHIAQGQLSHLESYLPFLATTGNISPFVGLLGTVMGIIDSFREIGSQGTASIAAVAPGVSEALVATAAGLFTAIPAVIAYNYFLSRIRGTAFRMDTVTVELLTLMSPKSKPASVGTKG